MTATGKVPTAKVLVLGTGVTGLATIQTAKNMDASVRAFDVRPNTKEQVEPWAGPSSRWTTRKAGAPPREYAKVMSKEWDPTEVDIVVTTELWGGQRPL